MAPRTERDVTIRLTRFCMKVVGFWDGKNDREQRIYDAMMAYTFFILLFAIVVEGLDCYHCWGDFGAVTMNICVTGPVLLIVFKLTICLILRDDVLHLLTFSEEHFWNVIYDDFGEKIMRECEKKGLMLMSFFSCAVQGSMFLNAVSPIFQNIGQHGTNRTLPFGVTVTNRETPYFEITYTLQVLAGMHCGICYFCFDNLMGILNIYVAGQFKILQHEFKNVFDGYVSDSVIGDNLVPNHNRECKSLAEQTRHANSIFVIQEECARHELLQEQMLDLSEKAHAKLKECIKQHILLIDFVDKLEHVFNIILLGQMGVISVFAGFIGFQVIVRKQSIFYLYLMSAFSEMLLITYTCNEVIERSLEIAEAAYCAKWYAFPETAAGRAIRHAITMVVMRAQKACCLSTGKFSPISLRSFTAIVSTTISYLSFLRQMDETEV